MNKLIALLVLCALSACSPKQKLVYPDATESTECSVAFDSIAKQIGSPHRTCKPKEAA